MVLRTSPHLTSTSHIGSIPSTESRSPSQKMNKREVPHDPNDATGEKHPLVEMEVLVSNEEKLSQHGAPLRHTRSRSSSPSHPVSRKAFTRATPVSPSPMAIQAGNDVLRSLVHQQKTDRLTLPSVDTRGKTKTDSSRVTLSATAQRSKPSAKSSTLHPSTVHLSDEHISTLEEAQRILQLIQKELLSVMEQRTVLLTSIPEQMDRAQDQTIRSTNSSSVVDSMRKLKKHQVKLESLHKAIGYLIDLNAGLSNRLQQWIHTPVSQQSVLSAGKQQQQQDLLAPYQHFSDRVQEILNEEETSEGVSDEELLAQVEAIPII